VESPDQLAQLGQSLIHLPVKLFRAGIWKPRTRPGSFEGMGEEGLKWLADFKARFGIPTAVEVATPAHVELALKYGIDALWIGARTTVSPFNVQDIADAVKGTSIPVLVKNPVNPDVNLWQGAIERFRNSGITELAAIHRGFSSYDHTGPYRNKPNWAIPIELRRRMPGLPIINDPSHIAGRRDLLLGVAQKAMDLGFEGLMIEVHPNPAEAWSDAEQQLTPDAYSALLNELVIRKPSTEDSAARGTLEYYRQIIDSLDAEIVDLIGKRMELASRLGDLKKECNLTAYIPERWQEIVETRTERGKKNNLDANLILHLFELIHQESIRIQTEVMNQSALKNS
jgi:chorismate mutase